MKKLICMLLVIMLLGIPALGETEVDAVSSASTVYYFDGMDGDALMDAINSYSGFYAISSVNADGTPNVAFFVYAMVKLDNVYYLQLGLSPNQTTLNIDNGSELMAIYGCSPDKYLYASTGARMYLSRVSDPETLNALSAFSPAGFTPLYYEVTRTIPMG